MPLCVDPQTGTSDEFCSSTFLGRTCKDWGNPVCDGVQVAPVPPLHPASTCSLQEDIVNCDASESSCTYLGTIDSCTVNCIDSCGGLTFEDSTVYCHDESSCTGATFRESEVYCRRDGNGESSDACSYAKLYNSAVHCGNGDQNACAYTEWFECNCCLDSKHCPSGVPLCVNPQTGTSDEFCSTLVQDKTCKDWGNPICSSSVLLTIPPETAPPTTAPFHTTINAECGVNNVNIDVDQPLHVLPCIGDVANVTVTILPLHGNVTVSVNGSIIYTPSLGFSGEDRFTTETCGVDGNCYSTTIIVQVVVVVAQQQAPGNGDKGGSFPLAALSVLALLPIIVIVFLLHRRQSGGDSTGKPIPHELSVTATRLEHSAVGEDVDATQVLRSSAPQQTTPSLGRDPSAVASAHAVRETTNNYFPAMKDQCRDVVAERQRNEPPLAAAIFIEPEAKPM